MIILLIAGVVSAGLGERVNASLIVLMVVLSVVLNFVQSYRSQRAAERLRETVAPTASVLRDGAWMEIARRELVPGDVIRLSAGDRIPADARLIETRDLHVQQAALTGESMPAEKEAVDLSVAPRQAAEARNMVFLGTSVVSGTAVALVVATGPATAFGDIAARLMTRPPETEFERGIRRFALLIMQTVVFLVLIVLFASVIFHRPLLESLLFAVALAVGLTPEFLPMITTVTLGQGALRTARHKVIVKHLEAIENFGSMDVLCSDKTGTLTTGEMVLHQSLDPFGQPTQRPFLLAYLNSVHETGIRSPLDAAILRPPTRTCASTRSSTRSRSTSSADGYPWSCRPGETGTPLLITKGAPEPILQRCTAYEVNGDRREMDAGDRARCAATYESLSSDGYRVLAVAQRRCHDRARTRSAMSANSCSSDSSPSSILPSRAWARRCRHSGVMASPSRS